MNIVKKFIALVAEVRQRLATRRAKSSTRGS